MGYGELLRENKLLEQRVLNLTEDANSVVKEKLRADELHIRHKNYLIDLLIKTGKYSQKQICDGIQEISYKFYEELNEMEEND